MDIQYWDGEMDINLQDLSNLLKEKTHEFRDTVQQCVRYLGEKSQKLITDESMNRFEAVVDCFNLDLESIFVHQHTEIFGKSGCESLSLRMRDWIMLGSAIETMLQIFLTIYLHNYNESNYKQWNNFDIDTVKKAICDAIDKLAKENVIDGKQRKSLKGAVQDKIEEHTEVMPIERVMLDDLITFYQQQEIFDSDDIKQLRYIQSNRNCIHAYKDRQLGNWDDLLYSIRFFCYLMENIIVRIPCIDNPEDSE